MTKLNDNITFLSFFLSEISGIVVAYLVIIFYLDSKMDNEFGSKPNSSLFSTAPIKAHQQVSTLKHRKEFGRMRRRTRSVGAPSLTLNAPVRGQGGTLGKRAGAIQVGANARNSPFLYAAPYLYKFIPLSLDLSAFVRLSCCFGGSSSGAGSPIACVLCWLADSPNLRAETEYFLVYWSLMFPKVHQGLKD